MFPLNRRYYLNAVIVFITIGSIFVLSPGLNAQSKRSLNSLLKKKDTTAYTPDANADTIPVLAHNTESEKLETDTVNLNIPLFKHGSIFLTNSNYYKRITKKDILWEDYFGLFDILANNLPAYPLYQGGYFLDNNLSMFGTGQRSYSFRFNNSPMNEANFGTFNMDMFSTEFMESVEILVGSDAVIFSNNSSGALINLQEIRYNASTPYTKLWINQAGTSMISSDGVFSQNILPNFNFTVGIRAISSDGDFTNQWVDSWNLRGILRWNLSPKTNISLTENFYNHAAGTNGGVNPELSLNLYNPREAVVMYDDFNERLIRHNLHLTLSSILNEDTTSAVSLTAFFTYADFYQRVPGIVMNTDTVTHNSILSNQTGVSGKFEQGITRFLSLKVGGDIVYSLVDKGLFNDEMTGLSLGGFGYLAFRPIDKLVLSGGVRVNSQLDRFYSSLGGKIQYTYSEMTSIFGDVSFSQRIPSPSEGLALKNENHFLILGGFKSSNENHNFEASIYLRTVANPITAVPVYDENDNIINTRSEQKEALTSTGGSFTFGSKFLTNFHYSIFTNISFDNWAETTTFSNPRLNGRIKLYYRFAVGRSEIRIGFDISGVYQRSWLRYFPQHRQYTIIDNNPLAQFNGLNIFAHAKLGNAYLKINLRNVTSNGYYFVAFYPKSNLYFNLAVNWAFLD